MEEKEMIKEEFMELLETYYNGSFPQMACDYIRSTEMTEEEVEELLETMKGVVNGRKGEKVKEDFFNNLFGRYEKNVYLCNARTRQASLQCLNRRVVFYISQLCVTINNTVLLMSWFNY